MRRITLAAVALILALALGASGLTGQNTWIYGVGGTASCGSWTQQQQNAEAHRTPAGRSRPLTNEVTMDLVPAMLTETWILGYVSGGTLFAAGISTAPRPSCSAPR